MITDSFDNKSKPIFGNMDGYTNGILSERVCIVSYSVTVLDYILHKYETKMVAQNSTANGPIPIYEVSEGNQKYLFYLSPIGATVAATVMYEISILTGAQSSGLQAVADHYGIGLFILLFGGDILKEEGWKINNLGGEKEEREQRNLFDIVLLLAKEIGVK